jgi:serine/threonine protein kinase
MKQSPDRASSGPSCLIHGDIKPANLFVCRHGREFDFVKVLDFGRVKSTVDELMESLAACDPGHGRGPNKAGVGGKSTGRRTGQAERSRSAGA